MLEQIALTGATGAIAVIYAIGFKVLFSIIKSLRLGVPIKESILSNTTSVSKWITLVIATITSAFIILAILGAIFAE